MKTALLIIAAAALVFSACYADTPPAVSVASPMQVTIDGQPAGTLVDALANGAPRPQLLDAVLEWGNKVTKEAEDAKAALSNERASVDALISDALADELKTGDGPVAARLRQLQAAIAASR